MGLGRSAWASTASEGSMIWTSAKIERLKALWAEGVSASLIAKDIGGGVTRNSVIGKIHRLKLPGRRTRTQTNRDHSTKMRLKTVKRPSKRTQVLAALIEHPNWLQHQIAREVGVSRAYVCQILRAGKPKPETSVNTTNVSHMRASGPPKMRARPLPSASAAPPNISPVRFLDRRSGQCAWPLWQPGTPLAEMTCCGNKCPREPEPQSCEFHAQMSKSRGTISERNALYGLKRAA
jgi:hypothetical protein